MIGPSPGLGPESEEGDRCLGEVQGLYLDLDDMFGTLVSEVDSPDFTEEFIRLFQFRPLP